MNISEIDWGNDSAEKDPNLLQYFISSSSYDRLLRFSKTFIIGRKGSGKTAIRRKLVEDIKSFDDHFSSEVILQFNIIRNIYSDNLLQINFNEEIFFQYIWLNYLYHRMFLSIAASNIAHSNNDQAFVFAKQYAAKDGQHEKTILDMTKNILTTVQLKAGKLGDLGVQIVETLKEITNIETYEYNLNRIVQMGFKITWIVDDLDIAWNNSQVSNNFLLGLLSCTNHLKSFSDNFHLFICLREDMYEILLRQTQHSDKYRDIERIRWNAENLRMLLTERIKHNYKIVGEPIPSDPFSSIFPDNIGKQLIDNWVFERTLNRPRELLQLSRLYTEANESNTPNQDIMKDVEKDYSDWKLNDLVSEYSNQYKNLSIFFSVWKTKFYRQKYHLSYSEISEIIFEIMQFANINEPWFLKLYDDVDINGMLLILYEIGYIGDFIKGGSGGNKTVYSYEMNHEPLFEEVQIHPCFRKSIGTVERIRKKSE